MKSLHLKIPSLAENIRVVESFIDNARETYKLNDDVYGNIMVAVTESVNNAIIHGNGLEQSKLVRIDLKKDSKKIAFVVTDDGPGFDYTNLPDPTAPENILKLGGRGIFLMRQLADLVIFSGEGSAVELQFKL